MSLFTNTELIALIRFNETCEDSQDFDVPLEMMQRLAKIGAVRRMKGSTYEMTVFGNRALATEWVDETKREHTTDGTPCWCNPETKYIDSGTGVWVIVHKEPQ